ncbi:MAG: helix-turn-helix transcriptional regulator [Acidobacteria bacterium]|nr:helix-turn-helix transcriptional regulator [Acidobacteriota bacterium]
MLYRTYIPSALLAPYVRFFWALEADASCDEEFVHRSMADGSVEIVFHYRGAFDEISRTGSLESSPLSNIQAQSTRPRRFATREKFGIFGAYLYPFAIPRFFGLPASDFTGLAPDLWSALGNEGKELAEMVNCAASNEQRVAIVTRYFERRLSLVNRALPPLHRAVRSIIDAKGDVNIAHLSREYSLSIRQFERKFKEIAGLPPKLYSRVIRFQAATQFRLDGVRDLTEIAYACGYYDQSHFIKEFREFSGYTPKEYFWNSAEGTQYMETEKMSHFSNS